MLWIGLPQEACFFQKGQLYQFLSHSVEVHPAKSRSIVTEFTAVSSFFSSRVVIIFTQSLFYGRHVLDKLGEWGVFGAEMPSCISVNLSELKGWAGM